MRCYVYKSLKKADTYVHLAARDDFGRLPATLSDSLGALSFVLEFDLDAGRTLPREDPVVVRENLASRGFHLQLPPTMHVALASFGTGLDERG